MLTTTRMRQFPPARDGKSGSRHHATERQYDALVNEVIRRIATLVQDRELLSQRHADKVQRDNASAEISRLQWRLARIVQDRQRQYLAN